MFKLALMQEEDFSRAWHEIIEPIIKHEDTFVDDVNADYQQIRAVWFADYTRAYIAEDENNNNVGCFFLRPYYRGSRANGVANAGFMTNPKYRNQGVATFMVNKAEKIAVEFGFNSILFHAVVAENKAAVALWLKLGYQTIASLPQVYKLQDGNLSDLLIMHKQL